MAASSGILGPVADAIYECPSGTCDWDAYSSLALCNSCVDIAPNFTDISCMNVGNSSNHRLCTYSLSPDLSSMVFTAGAPLLAWNLWNKIDDSTWEPTTWMNLTQDYTYGFDVDSLLLKLSIVRFDAQYQSTSASAPDDILPTVLRCELAWCVQYHGNTSVRDGKLNDRPFFNVPLLDEGNGLVPDSSKIPHDWAARLNATIQPFQVDNKVAETIEAVLASIVQTKVFNTSSSLAKDVTLLGQLPSSYASDYISGFADVSTTNYSVIADPSAAQSSQGRMYSLYYANRGNIWRTLDSVAASFTTQLRSGLGSSNVTGQVSYPVTYVRVVWPWLIYPAALTIIAAVLLMVTISASREKIVWKSSSLALLFHGIPERDVNASLVEKSRMEETADRMWAQLALDEDQNLRLSKYTG